MTVSTPPEHAAVFTVDFGSLGLLRRVVEEQARRCGLAGTSVDDLVLIANELATNVVRHGGGTGQLRVWSWGPACYCQVSDRGRGMDDPDRAGTDEVAPDAQAGRGLWMIRQLSDGMSIDVGSAGTTVTVFLLR